MQANDRRMEKNVRIKYETEPVKYEMNKSKSSFMKSSQHIFMETNSLAI